METISIYFQISASWSKLSNKQLRYVCQLVAADYAKDEIKTLCLLRWSGAKVIGRQDSGSYLLKRGKILFEVTPLTLAELLPHLDWLGSIPTVPVRISKINSQDARYLPCSNCLLAEPSRSVLHYEQEIHYHRLLPTVRCTRIIRLRLC